MLMTVLFVGRFTIIEGTHPKSKAAGQSSSLTIFYSISRMMTYSFHSLNTQEAVSNALHSFTQ